MVPFPEVDYSQFTMTELSNLTIQSLDTEMFRFRIMRSYIYEFIGKMSLETMRNFIVCHNQLCERLVAHLKTGHVIAEIQARMRAINDRPRDHKNHNLNLKPPEKRNKPENAEKQA